MQDIHPIGNTRFLLDLLYFHIIKKLSQICCDHHRLFVGFNKRESPYLCNGDCSFFKKNRCSNSGCN